MSYIHHTCYSRHSEMKKLLHILFFVAILLLCSESIDVFDSEHLNYLRSKEHVECGKINHMRKVNLRIINGKPVEENKYPWLINVLLSRNRKVPSMLVSQENIITGCTGSLISEHFVVTAGHCICDTKYDPETAVPCLPNNLNIEANQNRIESKIAVYYSGNTNPDLAEEFFGTIYDHKLTAYVYRYLPPSNKRDFSLNGDIAIIHFHKLFDVDSGTLFQGFQKSRKSSIKPICLPNPAYLSSKKTLNIKVAGLGKRYHETTKESATNTSCITNQGMKKNKQYPNKRNVFLACKKILNADGGNSYCINLIQYPFLPGQKLLNTLSSKTRINFHYDSEWQAVIEGKILHLLEVFKKSILIGNQTPQIECQRYWPMVIQAINGT